MNHWLLFGGLGLVLTACGSLEDAARSSRPAGSAPLAAVPDAGAQTSFVIEIDGHSAGRGYFTRSQTTFNGRAALMTEIHQTFADARRPHADFIRIISDAATRESLFLTENLTVNGEQVTRTVTLGNHKAVFRTPGKENANFDLPVPEGALLAVTPEWILSRQPEADMRFTVPVVDRERREVRNQVVHITGTPQDGGAWRADISWEEGGNITRLSFDATGRMLSRLQDNVMLRTETDGGALASVRTEENAGVSVAAEIPEPAAPVNAVQVSFRLPAWDNFNTLVYRPLPVARWREYLLPCGYQKVINNELHLTKNAPTIGRADLPLAVPPEMEAFCRAGENIVPDDPAVGDRARAVVNKEIRVVPALALLAGWVYQNIALDSAANSGSPAVTLAERRASAEGHARLFASLARALKVPTRLCGGLLVQHENAVRHVWCEVLVNGQWLPIDTTVNRIGLPAGYILTEVEKDGNGILPGNFAMAVRDGGLGLEFVSAVKNYAVERGEAPMAFTLFPDSKKTYVAFHGNWLANLYWGFSVVKPEKWRGNLKLKEVTITSPDGQAVVKIEALDKVLPCTRSQLDMTLASLGSTLGGFKAISSDLVRFGARRNNAMFADFSVAQGTGRRRCQMYVIPMRGRTYRVSVWASSERFESLLKTFGEILSTVSL